MSQHKARLSWRRKTEGFTYETYDRTHDVSFEGGVAFEASSAKEFLGNPALVNPEELFAASLASCHMLTFLAIAARSRLIVDSYDDEAVAFLDKSPSGKLAVTKVILRPRIVFAAETPVAHDKLVALHEKAHRNCFIANSVACEVTTEPRVDS